MLKQTLVRNDLSVKIIDVPLEEIPNNLADVTQVVLSMHRANGDLAWLDDERIDIDGEPWSDERVLDKASRIITDMSRNMPKETGFDINGPNTGPWGLYEFIQQTLKKIAATDARYMTPPLGALMQTLDTCIIEKPSKDKP